MGKSISGYGLDFEAKCSRYCLKQLGLAEPTMGFQRDVASAGELKLVLQNVGGTFVLASHNVQVMNWAATFGDRFATYSEQAYRDKQVAAHQSFVDKVLHLYPVDQVPLLDVLRFSPRVTSVAGDVTPDELEYAAINYGREKGWTDHQQGMRPRERSMG